MAAKSLLIWGMSAFWPKYTVPTTVSPSVRTETREDQDGRRAATVGDRHLRQATRRVELAGLQIHRLRVLELPVGVVLGQHPVVAVAGLPRIAPFGELGHRSDEHFTSVAQLSGTLLATPYDPSGRRRQTDAIAEVDRARRVRSLGRLPCRGCGRGLGRLGRGLRGRLRRSRRRCRRGAGRRFGRRRRGAHRGDRFAAASGQRDNDPTDGGQDHHGGNHDADDQGRALLARRTGRLRRRRLLPVPSPALRRVAAGGRLRRETTRPALRRISACGGLPPWGG